MSKKNIIINRSQLKKIDEAANVAVQAPSNNSGAFIQAANSSDAKGDFQTAKDSGGEETGMEVYGPNQNGVRLAVDVPQGSTIGNALQEPEISGQIQKGASVVMRGKGLQYETKKYTKKQLEEVRIANLKKKSKTYTKKALLEVFDDVDYIDRNELIDFCRNNDFYYVIKIFGIPRLSVANSIDTQREIINDICKAGYLEYSNEVDDIVSRKYQEGDNYDVVKLCSMPDENDYYIVWDKD